MRTSTVGVCLLEDGWRFVGCGVCEENWRAALGEKPTRFFGR
jgi:hypothetical protein